MDKDTTGQGASRSGAIAGGYRLMPYTKREDEEPPAEFFRDQAYAEFQQLPLETQKIIRHLVDEFDEELLYELSFHEGEVYEAIRHYGLPKGQKPKSPPLPDGAIAALLRQLPPEPDRSKPCGVLSQLGGSFKSRKRNLLVVREFVHRAGVGWVRTNRPERAVGLKEGLRVADWIGRLPNQARRRTAMTRANLDRIRPYVLRGLSDRQIAAALKNTDRPISYKTIGKLRKHVDG
jgi:hypothetical protein